MNHDGRQEASDVAYEFFANTFVCRLDKPVKQGEQVTTVVCGRSKTLKVKNPEQDSAGSRKQIIFRTLHEVRQTLEQRQSLDMACEQVRVGNRAFPGLGYACFA